MVLWDCVNHHSLVLSDPQSSGDCGGGESSSEDSNSESVVASPPKGLRFSETAVQKYFRNVRSHTPAGPFHS